MIVGGVDDSRIIELLINEDWEGMGIERERKEKEIIIRIFYVSDSWKCKLL
jgi:hypothetical protein